MSFNLDESDEVILDVKNAIQKYNKKDYSNIDNEADILVEIYNNAINGNLDLIKY